MLTATDQYPPAMEHLPPAAALLERFYLRMGLPLPRLCMLRGEAVPSPYRELLVHSNDMTPTLEAFWQQPLELRVLGRLHDGDFYLREVALRLAQGGHAVEYGAIQIYLDHFPRNARRLVLEEKRPLGKILELEAVGHLCWPQGFFRVQSDARMGAALDLKRPRELYGRRNVLLDGHRRLLAEVVEVLPPVEDHHSATR